VLAGGPDARAARGEAAVPRARLSHLGLEARDLAWMGTFYAAVLFATRYEKTARSFLDVLHLAATADWLRP
jgi:hypothetical protein